MALPDPTQTNTPVSVIFLLRIALVSENMGKIVRKYKGIKREGNLPIFR